MHHAHALSLSAQRTHHEHFRPTSSDQKIELLILSIR
jgi:hypothetical protein